MLPVRPQWEISGPTQAVVWRGTGFSTWVILFSLYKNRLSRVIEGHKDIKFHPVYICLAFKKSVAAFQKLNQCLHVVKHKM